MSFLILAAAMTLQVQVFTAQPIPPPTPRSRPPATGTAPATTADGALVTEPEPERVVCHSEPVTGSRFPRRVCRTERQIEADRTESQEMLRKIQKLPDIPAR